MINPKNMKELLNTYNTTTQEMRELGYTWFLNFCSEEEQLNAITLSHDVIKYITNPSKAVQLAAVKQYGWAIEYIANPNEEVQLAAVTETGDAISYITKPSEAVQLEAVQQNALVIKHIESPSEAVQEHILQYLPKQAMFMKRMNQDTVANVLRKVQLEKTMRHLK